MNRTQEIKVEAEIMNEMENLKTALDCNGVEVVSPAGTNEYKVLYQTTPYGPVTESKLMPKTEIANHLRSVIFLLSPDEDTAVDAAKEVRFSTETRETAAKMTRRQSYAAARATLERYETAMDHLEDLRDDAKRNLDSLEKDEDLEAWDIRDHLSIVADALEVALSK
jgi:hypothetical protein